MNFDQSMSVNPIKMLTQDKKALREKIMKIKNLVRHEDNKMKKLSQKLMTAKNHSLVAENDTNACLRWSKKVQSLQNELEQHEQTLADLKKILCALRVQFENLQ